jgi:hypothetical protein
MLNKMKRALRLTTEQQQYVLPWDFATVCTAIQSQNIRAKHLCFKNSQEKQQLCKDLFLLSAQGDAQTHARQTSPLALIARKLLN